MNLTLRALSVLRIVAGLSFSLHGFQTLLGLFGGMGAPDPVSLDHVLRKNSA